MAVSSNHASVIISLYIVIVSNIEGTATTSSSIYLMWSSPPLPVNSHYIIRMDELETSRIWTFFSVETLATVLSLHPYYHYSCQIAIVANSTIFPFSPAIIVQTLQSGNNNFMHTLKISYSQLQLLRHCHPLITLLALVN